jgi:hypothetical protein
MLQPGDTPHVLIKPLDEGWISRQGRLQDFDRYVAVGRRLESFVDGVLALMDEFDELILTDGFAE